MTTFILNGNSVDINDMDHKRLVTVLHDDWELTGTRGACGIGMCGACSVLVDGKIMSACLLLIGQLEGKHIQTIEGLPDDGKLHPVQQAYMDEFAFQCAYCTPGFIMTTLAMLQEYPEPDEETIREYLGGNLCRCGSYLNIIKAVQRAAKMTAAG